jgi:hypothetical protein
MTGVSEKYSCASCIGRYHAIQKRCSPKSQVPTGGSTLHTIARHSSYKAGTTSLYKGKALKVEQYVLACIVGRNILAVLLNQRYCVMLSANLG